VSVALINHGVIEWAHGYGVPAPGEPATTPETLFQAASISKPVSTFAVLRLVERGQLSLDEDVNVALRSWQVPASKSTHQHPVTLRGILTHSSGLNVHGFQGYAPGATLPSLPQILEGAPPANSPAVRVIFTPGSRQQYSGGGFVVLQQLVSDTTHVPFEQTMTQLVLAPLEMTHSVYAAQLPPELAQRAAQGHDAKGNALPGKWHVYPQLAAAGLWTTPSDLAHFALLLEQARTGKSAFLSQASAELMSTRQFGSFALGFAVRGEGQNRAFTHSGVNAGFRCELLFFPERGQGAVVMTNGDGGGALVQDILRALGHIYAWPEAVTEAHGG
jgi:CubicO group peptidase (beta-lactamase class C family)